MKGASGAALDGKYYEAGHQDFIEYLTQALECVHELALSIGPIEKLPPVAIEWPGEWRVDLICYFL